MKKLLGSVFAMMMAIVAFNSCSDVPEPFDIPEFAKDSTKTDTATVSPKGTGTKDDPYNVAAVLKLYSDGVLPENEVYIEGTVTEIKTSDFSTQYGNLTYYINDGGSTSTFYIYRGYYYNGDKFTSADQLKVGDKVVLRGTLTLYNNTKETNQGSSIISINGKTNGGGSSTTGTPKGSGTQADPYNATKAIQVGAALDENGKAEKVYVEGIVSQVKEIDTGQYGNATYYISEDGTTNTNSDQFYVYRGYNMNGDKFTSEDQLKVGMKVVVLGDIVNFKGNTVEMTQGSRIVSADGGQTTTVGLNETFAASQGNFTIKDISKGDGLSYVWKWNDSKYMRASAYVNKTNIPAQSRLTSPAFSLEGLKSATLTFDHAERFFGNAAEELKVQVSTDGQNWTDLPVSNYTDGKNWTFVTTTCDLSKYAGQKTVYIGFLYTSTSEHAATWEIKNVVVK